MKLLPSPMTKFLIYPSFTQHRVSRHFNVFARIKVIFLNQQTTPILPIRQPNSFPRTKHPGNSASYIYMSAVPMFIGINRITGYTMANSHVTNNWPPNQILCVSLANLAKLINAHIKRTQATLDGNILPPVTVSVPMV